MQDRKISENFVSRALNSFRPTAITLSLCTCAHISAILSLPFNINIRHSTNITEFINKLAKEN